MTTESERAGDARERSGRAPMEAIAEVAEILRRRREAGAKHETGAEGRTEGAEPRTDGGRGA